MNQMITAENPTQIGNLDCNHSHSQIVRRIPRYAHVLELGCSTGEMSKLMKDHCDARVFGVEQDGVAAGQAQRHCDYVFTENLDNPSSLDALQFETFDVITLVDVLEHIKDPQSLLERLKSYMMEDSVILLSVPNVAHTSVRMELLTGDFRYEDAGILDETHLKFFTLSTLQALIERAGFVIDELDYTWHDVPDSVVSRYLREVGIEPTAKTLQYFHEPEATAYQFIVSISLPREKTTDFDHEHSKIPAKQTRLKPMSASWQTWGQVFGNLQQKEQVIHGMELQIQSFREQLEQTSQELHSNQAELQRVYATRSWRLLRYLRKWVSGQAIQERLTLG